MLFALGKIYSLQTTHRRFGQNVTILDVVKLAARNLSFPSSNVHFEAFTAMISGDASTAKLAESKKAFEVKEQQTLLDVLRDVQMRDSISQVLVKLEIMALAE